MKPSLRANLTWKMTALFATTMLVLGAVAFWSSRSTVAELSDRIMRLATVSVDEKVQALLDKAETSGHFLGGLIAPNIQGTDTLTNSGSFDDLSPRLLEIAQANPEYSSVGFTWDRTGEFIKVLQLSSGRLLVQMCRIEGPGPRTLREFSLFGDRLELVQTGNDQSDRRLEPWYQRVKATGRQEWSQSYLITNTVEAPTPGVTFSRPVYDRANRFLGVAAVDITVTGLSRFVNRLHIGNNGYASLVEISSTNKVKAIAHPQTTQLVRSESGRDTLVSVEELGDPVLVKMKRLVEDGLVDSKSREPARRVFDIDGKRFQLGFQILRGERRPNWMVVVAVPDDEFMGGIWRTGFFLGYLGLLSLILVLAISYVMAQRVAKPLQDLVVETGRIKSLDLHPRPSISSNVREVEELGQAMETMKAGLRSLEKLVPGDYARYLIATGQEARLGGERRHITTYFGDIIGFTALSEKMEPEELVEVLAEYLDVLSSEVIKTGGTVDKFNGDDVMAFWGAPNPQADHAYLACKSAVASQKTLAALHAEWEERNKPLMRASFGISTGDVIVGNVGSRQRMNYTVIGDSVNLASRLQGLNKYYGTEILIGPTTREEAGNRLVTRLVDRVSVAGRGEPVEVFELLALAQEASDETLGLASKHDHAMELYSTRQWQSAIVTLTAVLKSHPQDGPSRILYERCEKYLKTPPPEDWNGAVQVSIK